MKKFDTIAALIEKGFKVSVTDLGVEVIEREYSQSYKMSTGRVIDCFMRVMVVIPNRGSDMLRVLYKSSYGFKDVTYTNTKRAFNAIRANIIREGYNFDAPTAESAAEVEAPAVERTAEESTQEAPMIASNSTEFMNKAEAAIREVLNGKDGQQIMKTLLDNARKENPNMTPEEWTQMKRQFMTFIFASFMKENPQAMRELGTHIYNELRAQ